MDDVQQIGSVGHMAVKVVEQGEKENICRPKIRCNGKELFGFLGIWLLTWGILACFLVVIVLYMGSKNVFYDVVSSVDMWNMSFSMVLSAFLEQNWHKQGRDELFYIVTLGLEFFLTFLGGIVFMAYSIAKIHNPYGLFMNSRFEYNLCYLLTTSIVIILGFVAKSLYRE